MTTLAEATNYGCQRQDVSELRQRHIKSTLVVAEDDLRKEVNKNNVSHAADRFSALVDKSTKLYEHEQPTRLRTEDNSVDVIVSQNIPVAIPSAARGEQPVKSVLL